MASFNLAPAPGIYPDRAIWIISLLSKEIKIPEEYSDFTYDFSEEKALVLPEQTKFNQYAIELEEGKQPPYGPIYSLDPLELETLKTYIEIHLKTRFIQSFKSSAGALILFDKMPDSSLCLCLDY